LRYLDRIQPLALLALRLTLGAIMIGHGYHKVNGHLHEHANFVASLHLPAWLGYVSSFTEFLGGILVLLGLCTRIAALAICINLAVAIFKVHLPHGLLGPGGYEFPLALATIAFSLIFFGAGPIAIDAVRGAGRSGGGSRSKSA
jgi:putative oxidoreductase